MLNIKLILFLLWEFEYYVGNNDFTNIKIEKIIDSYILKFDFLLSNLDDESKDYFVNKHNYEFLDLTSNLIFWEKGYNVSESFLTCTKINSYNIEYMRNYYIVMDECRLNLDIDQNKDEKWNFY